MQGVNAFIPHSLSSGLYRRLRNFTASACFCTVVDFTTGGEFHPAPRTYVDYIIILEMFLSTKITKKEKLSLCFIVFCINIC